MQMMYINISIISVSLFEFESRIRN